MGQSGSKNYLSPQEEEREIRRVMDVEEYRAKFPSLSAKNVVNIRRIF